MSPIVNNWNGNVGRTDGRLQATGWVHKYVVDIICASQLQFSSVLVTTVGTFVSPQFRAQSTAAK